jgi:mannose-6-phosphate isomerase-like protein (cupin superfamily)
MLTFLQSQSMVFKRLQSEVNILPILKQVAENWDDFNIQTIRQEEIPAQKETMEIRVRERSGHHPPHSSNHYECIYFLNWFEKMYGGKIYRAAMSHMPAGGKVHLHKDGGEYYENKDRFHLVLSGYYDYTVDGETQRFGAGDLFWFDNKKIHSSINATPIPRISLIFDVEGCTI